MTSLTEVPGEPSSAVTGPGGSLSDQLDGAHVAVVGLGRTGRAVVDALATLGARIHVFDSRESSVEMLQTPVASTTVADAEATAAALAQSPARLLVVSPGVPATGPVLRGAAAAGIETWSEVELAWRIQQDSARPHVPWLTLTGTDGKTTTVSMLSAILEAQGLTAPAVGNIGTPVIEAVLAGSADALAVELSSFQLHTTRTLAPLASACLNLAADHLDWHGGLEAYAQDKARVYSRTRLAAVYNLADAATEDMVRQADVVEGARAIGLTLGVPSAGQIGLVEDAVVDRAFGPDRFREAIELFSLGDLAQLAPAGADLPAHIVSDAMAAAALGRAAGVVPEDVRAALRAFRPGAHRIELAATVDGVRYVDDSKATNAHAARASLGAQADGTTVWIVGGLAKGGRFEDLVANVSGKLRAVVVIGVDQEPWKSALAGIDVPVTYIDPASPEPMDDAVAAARSHARRGDVVLLAPACASMDQFASYAERGERFAEAARRNDDPH